MPFSVHYALNLSYHAQKSAPFTLCSERMRQPVLLAFGRILILLLLCSSGDVDVNPGPVCPQTLSFVDFCNRKTNTTFSASIEILKVVVIYCRDSLQSSVLLSTSMPKQFKLLLLKIHLSRNKYLTVFRFFRL
jgi:hypothetical protein